MPKVKIPRKSTAVDMTAMCDVAFLLLTFFMLTSNFTNKEAAVINAPSSISEIKIPERNIMLVLVDANGKLFLALMVRKTEWPFSKKWAHFTISTSIRTNSKSSVW